MLMRSCLAHGTLNVQVKANAGIGGFRSDVSVLKQLAEFSEHPIRMVRAWRIDSLSETGDSADDFHANLQFLRRGIWPIPSRLAWIPIHAWVIEYEAAGEKRFSVNLLWSGGTADGLSDLLRRATPRTVYSHSDLTKEECATSRNLLSSRFFPLTKSCWKSRAAMQRAALSMPAAPSPSPAAMTRRTPRAQICRWRSPWRCCA